MHSAEAAVISQVFNGHRIRQRSRDGYLSATDMCKSFDKQFNNYKRTNHAKSFLAIVSAHYNIPVNDIIHVRQGGISTDQGSWIHPRAAVHLAQWLSPVFALNVCEWVTRFISGDLILIKDIVVNHRNDHSIEYLSATAGHTKGTPPAHKDVPPTHDNVPVDARGDEVKAAQDDDSALVEHQLAWQQLEAEIERACAFIERRLMYIRLRELDPRTWNV